MVSIKDVAKEAGVSATTVSAVVNGLDCVKTIHKRKSIRGDRSLRLYSQCIRSGACNEKKTEYRADYHDL